MKFRFAFIVIIIFIFGQGCSVLMATKQPGKKDVSVFNVGTSRAHVIEEAGKPLHTKENADGTIADTFVFVQGYSTGLKAGRAVFHGAADLFTFGLWEFVGTPIESIADGTEVKVLVEYDANEKVQNIIPLIGSEKLKGVDSIKAGKKIRQTAKVMEAKKSEEEQKFTTIQQDAHIRRVELESKPTEVSNRTESNEIIVVAPIDNRANDIAECVQNKMHRACPDLQFFHPEQFVDMFYPWFEPGTAPESKEDLQVLFNNHLVQEKIINLGIRYVVNIRGGTLKYNYTDNRFEISGVGGIMEKTHEKQTDAFVSVCDFKEAKLLLKTESHEHDTHYFAIIGFLPLWIPAKNTETPICEEIVNRLVYQLRICDPTVGKENK